MQKVLKMSRLLKKFFAKENWLKKRRIFAVVVIIICVVCASLGVPEQITVDGWVVIGTITLMLNALINDIMPTHFAMVAALTVILLARVITAKEALEGFGSSAVLSVGVLYVVAAGLTATGGLNYFMNKVLGTPSTLAMAQVRLMIPVCIISAFLNNTPVVALLIPIVQQWAPKVGVPVSQLFIPLSFASIFGGSCTLIGTSTNLVVAGKAKAEKGFEVGLFDLGAVGLPSLFTGIVYVILFSPWLLPNEETIKKRLEIEDKTLGKAKPMDQQSPARNERVNSGLDLSSADTLYSNFTFSCFVNETSPVVSHTVGEKLRGLSDLFLTSVQRRNQTLQAIGPEFVINAGDILFFSGVIDGFPEFCIANDFTPVTSENEDHIGKLSKDFFGLDFSSDSVSEPAKSPSSPTSGGASRVFTRQRTTTLEGHLFQVSIPAGSDLVGKTPKEVQFRRRYKAAILSIYRENMKMQMHGNLGRTVFAVGDELFILTSEEFSWSNAETSRDLNLISEHEQSQRQAENQPCPGTEKSTLEREFIFSMKVAESSGIIGVQSLSGKTIEAAGLRGLPGLFLIALEREGMPLKRAVGREETLEKGDTLWFVGERSSLSVLRQIPGLEFPKDQVRKLNFSKVDRRLVECVVSMHSDMIGKTIKQARFRSRFRAAVIAVHRQGQNVLRKIGDITIRAGDVLILDTGPYFLQRFRDDRNFLLIAEIEDSGVPQFGKFYLALGAIIIMMALFTAFQDEYSLFECSIIAAGLMLYFNILSPERAMQSINWDVIIAIATAFGLSTALERSGVATALGDAIFQLAEITNTGDVGILFAVYLATFLLSIVVANNAAALLMFPIAVKPLENRGDDEVFFQKVLFTLMLAASSSFSSPFGYQTNLMVYGPGGYNFTDFLKFGLPLQFWQMVFSVGFIIGLDQWYFAFAGSAAGFVILVAASHYYARYKNKQTFDGVGQVSGTASTATAHGFDDSKFTFEESPSSQTLSAV